MIYICMSVGMSVGMYVCRGPKSVGGNTWAKRAYAQSQLLCGKIRPVPPVLLFSTIHYSSFSMDGRETFT